MLRKGDDEVKARDGEEEPKDREHVRILREKGVNGGSGGSPNSAETSACDYCRRMEGADISQCTENTVDA